MNWIKTLNESLEYIEKNLTNDFTVRDVAKNANTSYTHYLRMFQVLSGMTLQEYIRGRRLSSAVADLIQNESKVIDVALKYQYATPEAFTKAFKKFHGCNPSEVKKSGTFRSFNKLSFQIIVKGEEIMKYEIIKQEELTFTGVVKRFTSKDGSNFELIPLMWQEAMKDGTFEKLMGYSDELGIVGMCYDFDFETQEFNYMIGVRNSFEENGMETASFKDQTFAAFEAIGALPQSIQDTTKQVFGEWFPSSNYEHSGGPEIEVYPAGDGSEKDYVCYLWVPIKDK